jgi:hypothetical protein
MATLTGKPITINGLGLMSMFDHHIGYTVTDNFQDLHGRKTHHQMMLYSQSSKRRWHVVRMFGTVPTSTAAKHRILYIS